MTTNSAANCLSTPVITYLTVANEQAVRIDCANPKTTMGVTVGSTTSVDFYYGKYQFLIGTTGFDSNQDVLGEIIKSFSFTK